MAYTLQLSIEGVMAEDAPEGLTLADVIPEGKTLFMALKEPFRIILSTLEMDAEVVDRWLLLQGIRKTDYSGILLNKWIAEPALEVRTRHVMLTRSQNSGLAYVVDSDPRVAKFCLERGVTPLLCPHPTYARSSFLPDSKSGGMSWDEIVETQTRQKLARMGDQRTRVNDWVEELEEDDQ